MRSSAAEQMVAPSPDVSILLCRFVANSAAMVNVLAGIETYARARTPLLVVGPTGTGKTTVAELIHALSQRPGPLATRTAAEFDAQLERSQLFGHERGAFTDAHDRQVGVLEEAGEGTLLLDDFHHLRRSTQALLLRVLDRGAFRRIGATRDLPVRCRVIIGLTESPDRLVERGELLAELRFRLGYSLIRLPSLEERRGDLPGLALQFLTRCPDETGRPGPDRFAVDVISVLQAAEWPGNLRQLEMVIRDAYLRAGATPMVRLNHLSELVMLPVRFRRRGNAAANARAVQLAIEATQGRVREAARLLGMSRSTLYAYLATRDVPTPEVERVASDNLG
jgi:DNA-binding NtrC family response regulator